jgi:hypothetical protein
MTQERTWWQAAANTATNPTHFTLIDLIALSAFGEEHKL